MRRRLAALLLALAALPAAGQESPVVSPQPDAVAVTVYRRPEGGPAEAFDLHNLDGYALITETRTVRVPAGPAVIRFEGVAGGIVPASAIVTGLPGGVVEKNRDARLLSPTSLVDGYLGRRVTLTRTDKASGKTVSEAADIVAGPENGVVVRTRNGVEALGCAGLADHPIYPAVPDGVSATPVLSVETVSPRAAIATVTLSYLASDFDWAASYVATIAPDGRHLDLFAWLTLANGNRESFPAAQVQAVAGRANHADDAGAKPFAAPLLLRCYPLGTTTSDLRTIVAQDIGRLPEDDIIVTAMRMAVPAPPPPPPPAPRVSQATRENLGDLKLYRLPERVTVAASAQKQVALLARPGVPFTRVYRAAVDTYATRTAAPTRIALRLSNAAGGALGVPLPSGSVALYTSGPRGRLLVGTGALADKAVGEAVRLDAGWSHQVTISQDPADANAVARSLAIANANPVAVTVELAFPAMAGHVRVGGKRPPFIDGVPTATVIVPANGRLTVRYTDLR